MEKYIVCRTLKKGTQWLVKILGLWFWGHKQERAFSFNNEKEALKIGLRETSNSKKKKKVKVVRV
ncbi:MAG: hypothetical protein KAJ58_02445 [Candidatus Pacebacteria bacterium]|nr:hypothetical protein [Candidatus Paceibacterota bacterium]